jgi:arylsulfatase A-like enzyme
MKCQKFRRRQFLKLSSFTLGSWFSGNLVFGSGCSKTSEKPNLVFVFADQWRACDTGYGGNQEVKTPNLDQFASESVNFSTAVSGCPVCSPYRASLMTGQYVLTHGVFYNDRPLGTRAVSLAQAYKNAGYQTGYIGKWHLRGKTGAVSLQESRQAPVQKEHRQGFDFWRVNECTHDYNQSFYYDENNEKHYWEGYDAIAQTKAAQEYIRKKSRESNPFILFLSWGPPHSPYFTAPEKYQELFSDLSKITVRQNVPPELINNAQKDYAGYYAHIAVLDDCFGELIKTVKESGIENNTILVFTSDHGDMLYSQDQIKKQKPWDESIRVPFLLRYPKAHGKGGKIVDMPINTPDIMPTLLGLSQIPIPDTVEGKDFSGVVLGKQELDNEGVLIMCPVPFHQWNYRRGGREYRGIRTRRYTYVRDLDNPWLLYDNKNDPFQLNNLINNPEYSEIQQQCEKLLAQKLAETRDQFLPGSDYMAKWKYSWDGDDAPDL